MGKKLHVDYKAGRFGTVIFAAQQLSQNNNVASWILHDLNGNFVAQPSQKYRAICQKKLGSSKLICLVYAPDNSQQVLYRLQGRLERGQFQGDCAVFDSNGNIRARLAIYGRIEKKSILVWGITDSVLVLKPHSKQGEM